MHMYYICNKKILFFDICITSRYSGLMKTGKVRKKINRAIRSFEAEEDVDLLLDAAQQDGFSLGFLCNTALRRFGRQIVREELSKQGRRLSEWLPNAPARSVEKFLRRIMKSRLLPDSEIEEIISEVRAEQGDWAAASSGAEASSMPPALPSDAAASAALKAAVTKLEPTPGADAPTVSSSRPASGGQKRRGGRQ